MDPVCGFPQGEGQGVIELSGDNCGLQGCHCVSMGVPEVRIRAGSRHREGTQIGPTAGKGTVASTWSIKGLSRAVSHG